MPAKSWCHDLENSCFLGNVLLYSLASTLSFEEDHFRRFNHNNKTLTVLPYPSDRNTVSGSEPTLSRTSCSPSTVCFLFIDWHNNWTKLPPNWLRLKTELNLHIKTTDADSNPGFSNRGLLNVSLLEVTDEAVQTSLIWHICHHADSSLCWHRQLVNYRCCCFTTSDRKQFVHRDERSRGGGDEGMDLIPVARGILSLLKVTVTCR